MNFLDDRIDEEEYERINPIILDANAMNMYYIIMEGIMGLLMLMILHSMVTIL